ncbi:MAG: DUF192 domain-containing protein [Bacteroidota bacterium]
MAKSKTTKRATSARQKRKKSVNFRQIALVSLLLLATVAFIFSSLPAGLFRGNPPARSASSASTTSESTPSSRTTAFKKEGSLTISKPSGELVKAIDIEIAAGETERNLGLMYRRSLPEDSGMLFLMDRNEEQSFWMKNTYLSLDIIYINEQKEVVSIAEGTTPLSEAPIPSNGKARYVLEVIAGYCQAVGIEVGDRVNW